MINTLSKRTLLIGSALLLAIFTFFIVPSFSNVYAQDSSDAVCETLGEVTGTNCATNTTAAEGGISAIITTAMNILSVIAGMAAVVMIMIAGVKFINSGGDAGKVAGARNTVFYAIVGLVIVALSQTIVFFLVGNGSTDAPPTVPPTGIYESGNLNA